MICLPSLVGALSISQEIMVQLNSNLVRTYLEEFGLLGVFLWTVFSGMPGDARKPDRSI